MKTMTEYISKEQAELIVESALREYIRTGAVETAFEELYSLPDADVAPVAHATTTDAGWDEIYCEWKTCNRFQGDNVSTAIYCNWCGARFDGGESNG